MESSAPGQAAAHGHDFRRSQYVADTSEESRKGGDDGLKFESTSTLHGRQRYCTRRNVIIASLSTLLILALSLGLGLGLGLKRSKESAPTVPGGGGGSGPSSLWHPAVNVSWQIVLSHSLKIDTYSPSVTPDVDVYDIDLFENTDQGKSTATIDALHKLGKKVVCYFSAGSYEPNRPDSGQFTAAVQGDELDGWPGEKWLDLKSSNVASIMKARIQLAARMGCDAVDPDNMDAYDNGGGGFDLTEQDSIAFMKSVLAPEASALKLAIGLKNAGAIIDAVLPVVQFSVNEQCAQYSECGTYVAFTEVGKPVFHIEYPNGTGGGSPVETADWCTKDGEGTDLSEFSTVIKTMDLNGWVQYCNDWVVSTSVN